MTAELIQAFDIENEVEVVKYAISEMLVRVNSLTVDSEPAFKMVTALYSKAREWQKLIETKRKEAIEPARKIVITINDKAKAIGAPLEEIIEIANTKAASYTRLLEQKRLADIERLNAQAALLDLDQNIAIAQVAPPRGDGAMAYTKVEKRFRVLDLAKVPQKYLKIDETLVDRDIKLGVGEIPGIEIYEETTTLLRRR